MAGTLYYDQYDYKIDDDPYPTFKRLRDEAPVWYNEKYDFWAISRFEDVLNASRDTETFSSDYNTVLEDMTDEPSDSTMIINTDPPYHKQLRQVVSPWFTPAKIGRMKDEVRAIVRKYLAPLQGRERFDFVEDFCRWIPMDVVSSLLGLPEEDRRKINTWGNELLHRDEGEPVSETGRQAFDALYNYFTETARRVRENPSDNLLSYIACGKLKDDDGSERDLTEKEIVEMLLVIAAAGNETAARLLASSAYLLATHPEQRQKLRDDPSLIPAAVEELLRFDPPSPIQFRRVLKDVELHGVNIPKGSNVCLLTASACRDERQFENPDRFDIERKRRRHVTFGYGVHTCLGASVARLEVRVALEEVLQVLPDWGVDEGGLQRVRTSTVRGYCNVPIVLS